MQMKRPALELQTGPAVDQSTAPAAYFTSMIL